MSFAVRFVQAEAQRDAHVGAEGSQTRATIGASHFPRRRAKR